MTSRPEADTPATAWPESLLPGRLNDVGHPTPFLITDCRVIEDRYRRLVDLVPGLAVFYAVKCNSSAVVLSTLAAVGAGFEVASSYELDSVTAAGVSPRDVLYSNTVKPATHVASAFAQGVDRFAFDSEAELRKLAAFAPGSRVYARLTVDDHQSLFPLSTKFGTTIEDGCRLLLLARDLGLVPYGLMFHVGSQCTDPLAWRRAMARCSSALRELERHRLRVEMLNIGGGMPARYVDAVPTVEEIAEEIAGGLARLPYRPPLLCAEPGRFLVAESAVLAATVIGIEDRGHERWAYLDVGGYNGLMETLQTGGRWHFPLATSRADEATVPHVPFTVTGPSCDSSDTMFFGADLPATLAADDRVYIGSTGAYTLSYASHFNGFPPPTPLFVNAPPPTPA
jgi:ornithine decarboxylase